MKDIVAEDLGAPVEQGAMEALRGLLLENDRAHAADLAAQIDSLSAQINDDDALIERINPILGESIRRSIQESREEMIEALYPIIGQLVVRAVTEAMRDLARTIDARMRRTFSPGSIARRVQAQVSGVSGADVMLRDALPFAVTQIFLIHRNSGLLLHHRSWAEGSTRSAPDDSDVISGMLTAISEFVRDAFGAAESEKSGADLDEIQYGDASILLETGRHAYIAVVANGVEPAGFRAQIRQCVQEFDLANKDILRKYDGNMVNLRQIDRCLAPLLVYSGQERADVIQVQEANTEMPAAPRAIAPSERIFNVVSIAIFLAVLLWLGIWLIRNAV